MIGGNTVDFAYACFNRLSVDRQSNCVSDVRCGPTIDAKMPRGTVLTRQQNVVFHVYLPTENKFIRDEACQLTPDASRMFQNLGMVEIGFTSRKIVREAIKFFRNAAQYLLHIRLAATAGGPTQQLLGDAIISAIKRTQGPMPSPPVCRPARLSIPTAQRQ